MSSRVISNPKWLDIAGYMMSFSRMHYIAVDYLVYYEIGSRKVGIKSNGLGAHKMLQLFYSSLSFEKDSDVIEHSNKRHLTEIKDVWLNCDECKLLLPDSEVFTSFSNLGKVLASF